MHPILFGHMDDEHFLWRHERTPWRRRLPPPCPTFGIGGSKRHLLGYDVTLGGLGFGGVGCFDDDLGHLDEGILLHLKIWPLESQCLPQEPQPLALLSERRAFVDSATLVGDGVAHLIRAGEAEGSPLRVLRDADRARLERFALSTSLNSLERVSSLIGHEEARELVRGCLERVGRVLDAEDNWVADFDVSLRLLKLAISTGDWASAEELRERMDRVWGTVDALRAATTRLYYRGRELKPGKAGPWTWLRNYLHARRFEAIISALPIGMDAAQIETRIPKRSGGENEASWSDHAA
jgi:hypothetical protein